MEIVGKRIKAEVFHHVVERGPQHVMDAIHAIVGGGSDDESSPMELDDNDFDAEWAAFTPVEGESPAMQVHRLAKHGQHNNIAVNQRGELEGIGSHSEIVDEILRKVQENAIDSGILRLRGGMARSYGRYRKRRGRRRRKFRRRRGGFQRKVRRIARNTHELKFVNYAVTATESDISYDGGAIAWNALGLVAQGAGNSQRIGRKIFCENLYINGTLTGAGSDCYVRIVVVRYRHTMGTVPTAAALFEGGVAGANLFLAYKDIEDGKNCRILWDHVWKFSSATGNTGAFFRKRIPIKKHMLYDGGTAATGDVNDGALGFYVFSNVTNASNNSPALYLGQRMRFRDA